MNLSSVKQQLQEIEDSYRTALGPDQFQKLLPDLKTYALEVAKQIKTPYAFSYYHELVRTPVDYYALGLALIRPLLLLESSKIHNLHIADEIADKLNAKENVVLLANHQIEPDPQVISLLLEKSHRELAEKMIFVAGHRVTQDPLAIPFSLGRNLLCIYSKKHIEIPSEKKGEKQHHNQKTMQAMCSLLDEGGKCIYVAPSGGRDRPDSKGVVSPAPFDPQSVTMFHLMAERAKQSTHFYPFALQTYDLFPPPSSIGGTLGEARVVKRAAVQMAFGEELDMHTFSGHEDPDKKTRRLHLSTHIWQQVIRLYSA